MTIRVLIERICPECNGVGRVMQAGRPGPGIEPFETLCFTCKGQGTVPERMPLTEFKRLLEGVKP